MTELRLPSAGTAITPTGPVRIHSLEAGSKVLGVREGRQAWERIESTKATGPAAAIRLLTSGSDVVLGRDCRVGTPRGLTAVHDLRCGDRIELLEPASLPPLAAPAGLLERLTGISFALPATSVCGPAVEDALRELLAEAGAEVSIRESERWLAIEVERVSLPSDWTWERQADALFLLCAWESDEEGASEARAILAPGAPSSQLLLDALIGGRHRFLLRWTPSYLPVELRVTRSSEHWPAYLPVLATLPEQHEVIHLTIDAEGWWMYSGLTLAR